MKKTKSLQAVTIIELVTVLVIIMIIAGMVTGVGRKARIAAMEARAKGMIAALEIAISMYKADTGVYPGDATLISNLLTLPGAPVTGWRGPYMEFKREDYQDNNPATGVIVDPWGEAYRYNGLESPPVTTPANNPNSFDLWSKGFDTVDNSGDPPKYGDDIHNW